MAYTIVWTSKFKKGTDVGSMGEYETEQKAAEIMGEKQWGGTHQTTPSVIPTSEVQAFRTAHQTGIFKPSYVAPTSERPSARSSL